VVLAFFICTSSGFLKSVVLPRVGKSMNAEITASSVELSPFKEIVLRDLKLVPNGADPLFTAKEVQVRYALSGLLAATKEVEEIKLTAPAVFVVEKPNGTRNLDPLLQTNQEPASKSEEQTKFLLKRLSITDGSLQYTKHYDAAKKDLVQVSQFALGLENVGNGTTGKATIQALLNVQNDPPAPGTNGALQAKLEGNYEFALGADLSPASLKGGTKFEVQNASGALAQAQAFGAELQADITPTQLREVVLKLRQRGESLGQLSASGSLDLGKKEGKIAALLTGIDHRVFNMAGASQGLDFGGTTLTATNLIDLSQGGQVLATAGRIDLLKFQMTRTNQTTPTMDLHASYDVTVDLTKSNALVRVLNLSGVQQGNELLRGQLSAPLTIAWGGTSSAVGDSSWNLALTRLNLADWKPFIGDVAPAGLVTGDLKLSSQQAGSLLGFDLASQVQNLTVVSGSNRLDQVSITASVSGTAKDLDVFNLPKFKLQLGRAGQDLLDVSGAGTYSKKAENADFQVAGQAMLDKLAALFPQPDTHLSSGVAEFKTKLTQQKNAQTIAGNLVITNLTGNMGSNQFKQFSAAADVDVSANDQQIQIRKLAGGLFTGSKPGGRFEVSGTYGLSNNPTRLSAKLTSFNQDGLLPFLEPMLTGKQLVSVIINGDADIQLQPAGSSTIKSDFAVTNLVVHEGGKPLTPEPLSMGLAIDTTLAKNVVDLRTVRLALTPTTRATNIINLTGKLDTSDTKFTRGNLKIDAPSLDVTRYYDVFLATSNTTTTSSTTTRGPSSATAKPTNAAGPETEPEPMVLPLTNFLVEATAGRVYLHEVELTNFQGTVKIDGGKILVKPLQVSLNGAPVSSSMDLDLGVPGFKYDVSLSATKVPLTPIVNSFLPERRGQIGGTASGAIQIAGLGSTGPSLQKNLKGSFDFGTTNLNLAIPSIQNRLLRAMINVIAVVPTIVKSPNAVLGTLTGALLKTDSTGTVNELTASPLDVISAKGTVGSGRVDLQDALIQSAAFQSMARGTIVLQPVITNSTMQIPLSITLKRSLAAQIGMMPQGTPTNVVYVKLPDYVTIKGTLGEPKPDINKLALVGSALQISGSGIPGVDDKTSGMLRNIGGVLTGNTGTNTAAGTNQSSQNVLQSLGNILGGQGTNQPSGSTNHQNRTQKTLQGLGGILNSVLGTNQPAGTTNSGTSTTNQNPVGSLLDQLLQPKKK
jgi:hypothetical protein